jgi:hypothetical protein
MTCGFAAKQRHSNAETSIISPAATATGPSLVRAELLERIPSPLTLGSDLGKRLSAQRLALDT